MTREMREITFLVVGLAVCVPLAILFPMKEASSQSTQSVPRTIILQVQWASDGTYVNGRKVAETWVAITPPSAEPQVKSVPKAGPIPEAGPIPQAGPVPQSEIPLPNAPAPLEKSESEQPKPEQETHEPVVFESVAPVQPEAVPPPPIAPIVKAPETTVLPSEGLIPLPPAVTPVEKPEVKVRRGLFGRYIVTEQSSPRNYAPCKQPSQSNDPTTVCSSTCPAGGECQKQVSSPTIKRQYQQQRRFGNGRFFRLLFRNR
jgi:hypothetical protein